MLAAQVLLWKTQNPWAGLRGQMYDWRLQQTGSFYGVRAACEPLHVQLNLHTLQVTNTPQQRFGSLRLWAVGTPLMHLQPTAVQ